MKRLIFMALAVFIATCAPHPPTETEKNLAQAYLNQGRIYAVNGQHDKAISDCSTAIEINPRYTDVYYFRGISYGEKGQYDKAISDCSTAIEINPRYAEAYLNQERIYAVKGHYDRAIADYNKAIEINFSGTALPMTRY